MLFSLIIFMTYRGFIDSDYHMHSTFSFDAQDSMESLCRRALELGFTEIAFTEHAEWHPDFRGVFDVDSYFLELERCRARYAGQGLTIYSGVELGNPQDYSAPASRLVQDYPFEVRIASLHWLYGENIHDSSCFAGREPLEVYADYFTSLGHMAADFSDIDIIAHFDRILWRGSLIGARFDLRTLQSVIRDTLATIAWRGLALELNTRLLAHQPNWRPELVTMLRWFREEGGRRVVVNSDSHRTSHLGTNLELARETLAAADISPERLQLSPSSPELIV
jgi:histidinol-phosphatase (PHP family)